MGGDFLNPWPLRLSFWLFRVIYLESECIVPLSTLCKSKDHRQEYIRICAQLINTTDYKYYLFEGN